MNGFITRISTIVTFDTRREDERALLLRYVLISLLIVLTSKNVCHFSVIPCKRTLAQKCKENCFFFVALIHQSLTATLNMRAEKISDHLSKYPEKIP